MQKLLTILAASLGANRPLANVWGRSLMRRRTTDPIRANYPKPVIAAPGEIKVWNEMVVAKKRAKKVAKLERDRLTQLQASEGV